MDWSRLLEVLVVVVFTSAGQLLLRAGARGLSEAGANLSSLITYVLQTPLLWLAVALYGVSTLLWIRVLSRYPVGSVYPMVAIGYVLVTTGGVLFLGEKVPLQGWIALAVICFGTVLLAMTPVQSSS
ncbi:MAG: 4-amino-4-deoxy-L-arabinose transferase [Chloroflexi bacterium]|nr:4-amino-4-deoxy-L-arabinose transferase [Chloroflexota bacterium]